MKKPSVKSKMRDLLCFTIETLLANNQLSLEKPASEKFRIIRAPILGKDSVVILHEMAWDLHITLYWDYIKKETPLVVNNLPPSLCPGKNYANVVCDGFLARNNWKQLEGKDKKGIGRIYCSKEAQSTLMSIPDPLPSLFQREGIWLY